MPKHFNQWFLENKNASYSYSSVQANLPSEYAKPILECGKAIPDKDIFTDPEDPSFGRENEIHITVRYGLHCKGVNKVRELLKDFPSFDIVLGETSLFETNPKFDVLKIEIGGPKLVEMNKLLAELPHTDTHPHYHPHCTIAYLKKNRGKMYSGDKEFLGTKIHINKVVFSSKSGEKTTIWLG